MRCRGAQKKIKERRRDTFLNNTIDSLLVEAKTLGISIDELVNILRKKEGMTTDD